MDSSTPRALLERIAGLRRRWLAVHSTRYALQALFYLSIVGAVALLAFPGLSPWTLLASLVGLGALGGAALALLGRPGDAALAKDYDDAAGLADRLSSTLELSGVKSPMVEALVADAEAHPGHVEPARVYPLRVPREGWWLPAAAVLLAGVLVLNDRAKADGESPAELVSAVEELLARFEEPLSEETDSRTKERREELKLELEKLKLQLKKSEADQKDAMAEVARMLDQMEKEREAEKELQQKLKQALQSQAQQNDQLADSIERADWQDALNKLREEIERLEKELEEKKKDGASEEELAELEQKLKELKEIEAKLMQLQNLELSLALMDGDFELMEMFEGELGELGKPGKKASTLKPCDCDDPGT